MIAYIYDKYSFMIENKIDNIVFVSEGEILGDSKSKFGGGSNYIILQSDTINLNKNDVIDITKLDDCRNFYLKGSDYWYQEQMNKHKEQINNLQLEKEELQCFTVDLQFQIDMASL